MGCITSYDMKKCTYMRSWTIKGQFLKKTEENIELYEGNGVKYIETSSLSSSKYFFDGTGVALDENCVIRYEGQFKNTKQEGKGTEYNREG